jgi:hypothetical protein
MLAGVPVVAVCSSPRTGSARSVSRVPSGRRLTEAYQPQVSPTGVMVTNVPVSGPAPGSGSASRHHQGLEDDSSRRSMRGISQVYRRSIATRSRVPSGRPAIRQHRELQYHPGCRVASASIHASSGDYGPYLPHKLALCRRPGSADTAVPAPVQDRPHPCLLHVCSDVPVRAGSGRYHAAPGLPVRCTARQVTAFPGTT